MAESDCLGNTKRTGVYIFNKSVSKCPNENVPKNGVKISKRAHRNPKPLAISIDDFLTLERGHLSWFCYPTHSSGTYLGRGVLGLICKLDLTS